VDVTQTPVIEHPPIGDPLDADLPAPALARPRTLFADLRAPLGLTLFLHVLMALCDRVPSVDGIAYFEAGRNLIGGHGYVRLEKAELHFPPVTPVGFALLQKITGTEMRALGVWNVGWGVALVVCLIVLAERLWHDRKTTVATAWFAGTMAGLGPLFFRYGGGSESASAVMILGSTILVIDGLRTPSDRLRRRLLLLTAAGALVGLAYLTRPESLMPGAILGFAVIGWWVRDWRANGFSILRPVLDVAVFGVVIVALSLPYVAYLHSHTGKWSPTAKTQDVSIDAWKAVAENNRLERDRILYQLNQSKTGLAAGTKSLTTLAREHPAEWRSILAINARTLKDEWVDPQWGFGPAWTLVPIIPLVAALAELWFTRKRGTTKLLAALAVMPLLTCLLFFTLPRYLVLTTAVVALFGAAGFVRWLRAIPPLGGRVLIGFTVAMTITSFLTGAQSYLPGMPTKDPVDQVETGRWLEAHTPKDARIMTRSYHVQGYAHRPVVAMPYTDYPTMITFARRMGVSYIVADAGTLAHRRPELYAALMTNWSPPKLKLVKTLGGKARPVRIYQLDPLPPKSDLKPIYLGYVSD
jgi:hypothetical protein